jgi:hypothetical protein
LPWFEELDEIFRMVESGVVQNNRDLLLGSFALKARESEDDLFGVLVSFNELFRS